MLTSATLPLFCPSDTIFPSKCHGILEGFAIHVAGCGGRSAHLPLLRPSLVDLFIFHRLSVIDNRHVLLAREDGLLICVLEELAAIHNNSSQEPGRENMYPRRRDTCTMVRQPCRSPHPVSTEKSHRIIVKMPQTILAILFQYLAPPRWVESGILGVPHPTMVAAISDISQPHL